MNADRPFRGLVGLYALALMEREGAVHGYLVAERIAERTDGQWHPGAGAIYPSLQRLAARRLARGVRRGRRTLYTATPAGRALLRRFRTARTMRSQSDRDLMPLWAEVVGERDLGAFVLSRLHRDALRLGSHLESLAAGSPAETALRGAVVRELEQLLSRFQIPSEPSRRPRRPRVVARRSG